MPLLLTVAFIEIDSDSYENRRVGFFTNAPHHRRTH